MSTGNGIARERRQRFEELEQTITKWWPTHWPAMEACLSAASTLYLKEIRQAIALILIARSGAGKGTILDQFENAANTITRDDFTISSLLSGFGEAKKKDLEGRALFRLAKHKTLIIADLNPMFKTGDRVALGQYYSRVAVWLDGRGILRDTGTHGKLGEKGDFSFVLLGGATPFRNNVWRAMAELGPRLLFYPVPPRRGLGPSHELYTRAALECAEATQGFLNWLANEYKLRSEGWPVKSNKISASLETLCQTMAAAQTMPGGSLGEAEEPIRPSSSHLAQRLATICAARAWLNGRDRLDLTDVAFAERVALASCPSVRGAVLLAMSNGEFGVLGIARRTGYTVEHVQTQLVALERVGIVERCGTLAIGTRGRPSEVWKLRPEPED